MHDPLLRHMLLHIPLIQVTKQICSQCSPCANQLAFSHFYSLRSCQEVSASSDVLWQHLYNRSRCFYVRVRISNEQQLSHE